ncbi:MAG: response regulator [Bacteroidetes bacterium]|nr:response regulator [Bacteroidota bacterium]
MVKVMIVDDSEDSRILLKKILMSSFKVEIVESVNGKEALNMIPIHKPDIVFLDYEMPVMDGKETLKSIRANPGFKKLPVIIISSHSEAEVVKELLSYKIATYLVKPFNPEYIVKILKVVFPKFNDK